MGEHSDQLRREAHVDGAARSDWVAGFSVLLLVAFTLSIPLLLKGIDARWIHIIAFSWGFGVATFYPRD